MGRNLTILLFSGSMMSMEPNVAVTMANAALDKGIGVNLFLFGEAVTNAIKDQAPKRFPSMSDELEKLLAKGMRIAVCSTCIIGRGIKPEYLIEGAEVGSLTEHFSDYMEESDRMIMLGR
jgi:sulfur relay (sulfurtransferase) complex TusBCD TusD component (DsrE family)